MMAIELPSDTEEMFQSVSRETGRPLKELVQEALDRFLEEWENRQDAEDARIALEEYERTGVSVPWEQVKQEMGLR
ncbi:hypothetical protein [Candidatus Magnetaquicoccus inordinatus]|uniref:hypothetical protein n=1 Tax=Candidatus Magnetaquicoccus inordinatus TaxID=2496818 RepID=UPI00102CB1A2|nr:hypothetical protein [Candidatus Magnetaquicoccus inordinatus]